MTLFERLRWIFWNKTEKRLRAIWRIGVHTLTVLAITSVLTVGIMLLTLIGDALLDAGLGEQIMDAGPMRIMEIPWIFMIVIPAATFLGVTLATLLAGNFIDRRNFNAFGINFSKHWWRDLAFGLGLGAGLIGMIFLFGWLTGMVRVSGFFQPIQPDTNFWPGFLQSLVFFVFVGIYEELLSRGYHLVNLCEGFNLKGLSRGWAIALAVLTSSLVFGLLHFRNPNASWVSTLNISVAGLVFSLGMILTGRLAIPMGVHITWNFFLGNVFGFPVSGMRIGATLIATQTTGPDWLTGGPFGPEAGLLGLAALLLGGGVTLLWLHLNGEITLQTDLAVYQPEKTAENPEQG